MIKYELYQSTGGQIWIQDRRLCIDPVNFCSGLTLKGVSCEQADGRRHQEMYWHEQSSVGDGN